MFNELEKINIRPKPFEFYTADQLWTDEHTSKKMLSYHLNSDIDISSRNHTFIDKSVQWMVSHFNIGEGTKIADFGCGPGLYSLRIARQNANVTGIDFSPRSIEFAQGATEKEKLSINFINQNYLKFETHEHFHLIIMIMCDFCALSPSQRKKMLSTFHKILLSSGSLLLDVYSLLAFKQREELAMYALNLLDGFWSPHKYYGFLNTFKYENEKVILDKYTIIEPKGTRVVYNWLQYYSPAELERELAESGFIIEEYYFDVAGSPFNPQGKEFAIVAKKR